MKFPIEQMGSVRRTIMILAILLCIPVFGFFLGPRPKLVYDQYEAPARIAGELKAFLESLDAASSLSEFVAALDQSVPLKDPMNRSRLRWFHGAETQTKLSVVYLHGFSASPLDLHPTLDLVAESLQANLFQMRMTGHGLADDGLNRATAAAWLEDAEKARAIGKKLGQRTLLVGMSTGASVAALSALRNSNNLAGLVLLSPNFGVVNPYAAVLTWPWGVNLASFVNGSALHTWKPESELRDRLWTSRYSLEAAAQMQLVVDALNQADMSRIKLPTLFVHSNIDNVVNIETIKDRFFEWGSALSAPEQIKGRVALEGSTRHELAGNAVAPELTTLLADTIVAFFKNVFEIGTEMK